MNGFRIRCNQRNSLPACKKGVKKFIGRMGENHFHTNTIIVYGILLMICGVAYTILQHMILKTLHCENELIIAIKKQTSKVIFSQSADLAGILFAFSYPVISGILFVLQSITWLVPDKNIERAFKNLPAETKL